MSEQRLSALDAWTLARLTAGYDMELPAGLSPRIQSLAKQLLVVNVKDRDFLLRRNLSATEHKKIGAVDTEAPMPKPPRRSQMFRVLHARELKNLPPLKWIIPGEIPESSLCVIFGESGAGKSFVSIDYALQIAQTRRVIYIPTEGELGYRKRVEAWCKHHRLPEGDLHFILGVINLYDKRAFQPLLETIRDLKPTLVVIDTLAAASAGADENSSRDMGLILRSCREIITESGASVALVHHVGKAGVSERGSSALRGNADVMIRVSPADDVIMVECSKTKDEAAFPTRFISLLPVDLADSEQSLVVTPADKVIRTGVITPNQRKVLEVMALESNRDGISTRDIAEVANLPLGSVMRALSNLLKFDYVEKKNNYRIAAKGLLAMGFDPDLIADDPGLIAGSDRSDSPDDRTDRSDSAQQKQKNKNDVRESADQRDQMDQVRLLDAPVRKITNYHKGL